MKSRFFSGILFMAAAMLAVGLSPVGVRAQEQLTVRLDFSPAGIHAAMHLANEKGWFAEAGLDVEVIDGKGTANTIQLIASGQGDVGQVQLGPMAVAREKGLPLKSFAGWIRKSDLAVLVPEDSPIETVADLKGTKGVSFAASPWVPYINQFLSNGGISRDDFDIAMVSPAAMFGTYISGEADAVLTIAAGLPIVAAGRPSRAILSADYGIAFPSYGFLALEETLETRAEALGKLAKVQQRAWAYIYDGHVEEAVAAIQAQRPNANVSDEVLRNQIELYRDLFHTERTVGKDYGWQSADDWQDAIGVMVAAGLVNADAKPGDYFTNALLD